ncbi:MAG: YjbQ family protein [Chloroflexi bacterium]|nr:YjbQ family protein [Chloroflexota bacterium]
MVITRTIYLKTEGQADIVDLTPKVRKEVETSGLASGIVDIFVSGSTAGVTTIEYESGLLADFKNVWQRIAPAGIPYEHDSRWGDANGFSHVRASILGGSLVVPFTNKTVMLGTWQQIVLVDFDNRARNREIVLQIIGE